jgi:hypothetical protein
VNAYARAAGSAALQGVATGLYAAAAALPTAQRRTARGVTVAGLSVAASLGRWAIDRRPGPDRPRSDRPRSDRPRSDRPGQAQPAVDDSAAAESAASRAAASGPAGDGPRLPSRAQLAALAAGLGVSTVSILARRRLERWWLAGLRAQGHPHPYRVLGFRMGLLGFAGALPAGLIRANIRR